MCMAEEEVIEPLKIQIEDTPLVAIYKLEAKLNEVLAVVNDLASKGCVTIPAYSDKK